MKNADINQVVEVAPDEVLWQQRSWPSKEPVGWLKRLRTVSTMETLMSIDEAATLTLQSVNQCSCHCLCFPRLSFCSRQIEHRWTITA